MVFHTPQRRVNYPVLKLNNVNIERVSQFNFLGVVINSTLKWDKHIAHISLQCIRKVTIHESQSGSRKFNLREPLFCYGSHI